MALNLINWAKVWELKAALTFLLGSSQLIKPLESINCSPKYQDSRRPTVLVTCEAATESVEDLLLVSTAGNNPKTGSLSRCGVTFSVLPHFFSQLVTSQFSR